MINIDETSFNRHMKINYSWGVKGYPVEAKNSPFSDSVSAWMATLSNGSFIAMLTNETINSHKFRLFLRQLHRWLKNNEWFEFDDVLILMDNWSIHKSGEVRTTLLQTNYKIMFLPAYTPQWVPIEKWFGILKSILCKENKTSMTNLSNKSNFDVILKAMRSIKSHMIINSFTKMRENIKKNHYKGNQNIDEQELLIINK